ncbi:MAG: hypothetical protein Q7S95_00275 [bacterium]|nr:hypothetical protein [bacterium]
MQSFGNPRLDPDEANLKRLYKAENYAGMLKVVKDHLRMPVRLTLGLHNNDDEGPRGAPAWLQRMGEVPLYGTQALGEYRAIVYIRRSFISRTYFEALVLVMAHEISHLVLHSTRHSLRNREEAVDLTAMLLGYRSFYVWHTGASLRGGAIGWALTWLNDSFRDRPRYGYLSFDEIRYAARLMQT